MNRKVIYEIKGMYRDDFRITGFEFGQGKKAVCIVGSSRGNEVQQIYCCAQLVKYLFSIDAITNAQKENKQFKSEIGV